MKKLGFLSAAMGLVGSLWAQPSSVEDALTLALQHNPRAQALYAEIESAQRLQRSASALSAPTVLLAPGLTLGGTGEEFLLHQPLELTGIRQARRRVGKAQYELTRAQALLELNDLLAQVASAYYEYVYRTHIAQIAHDALQLAERTCAAIQQQVEAGVRPGVDLLQAEIERERIRQHAQLRQTEADAAQTRLRALLGEENSSVATHGNPSSGGSHPIGVGQNPDSARRNSDSTAWDSMAPVLRLQTARLHYEQALAQQIRAEALPDVGLQVRIERFNSTRTRPAYGLNLSLPLLDYGARQNRLRAQNALIEAQRLRLQDTQRLYEADLRNAEQRLQQAQTRVDAYQRTLLPRAQQLAQAAQVGLEAGQLGILQLLEAQRTARTVQEEALQAELELKLSETELKRLRGTLLPKEVN